MVSRISKKICTAIILAMMLIALSMPSTVFAEDSVSYLYRWEGSEETKTLTEGQYVNFPESGGTLANDTYVVNRDITLSDRLVISGVVKIILMDGKTLNAPHGVTVAGSDTLYVYGQEAETGKLVAGTTGNATSAAIGGGFRQAGGTMHFCSGIVEAKLDSSSSQGAAIGGGDEGDAGNITIHGGNITADASAGTYGAGIGGGDEAYGGKVTIWDGTVNATGAEFGAGIGSGDQPGDAPVMTVNIKGGTVTATGGDEAAGIGGGNEGKGANVNISGGTVTASGGNQEFGEGAGIGGGDEGDGGEVNISGGYVKASGGYRAAGIGGGADGSNYRVFITGGEVHAFGGGPANSGTRQSGGAGIGGGAKGYGGVIHIKGGEVEAKGVWGGAGIGGGYGRSVINIAISGDDTKVSANGDKGAAAIGGGCSDGSDKGDAYSISISGGEVDARIITPSSGVAGAAIGSGDSGYAANIAITGGTVKAMSEYGNNGAAAIGGGNKGYFGNIRIEGGNITAVQAYGGAGIGSGSDSEKGSEQAVGKITISGGTIRSAAVTSYGYHSTGAGIGSGSSSESPVNIEITGGNINAYCAMDDGSGKKLEYSGAGIGSGYGSWMGLINISGGTILATRGKGCTNADPIGYYNDRQNSVYPNITFNYDKAQIRSEKGAGTDKRVKNTQYDDNTNLSRRLALLENDSDWVEIKPCDHVGAEYEIVSAGENGTHKMNCEYCLSEGGEEHVHAFNDSNQCSCGYYRYKLTFKDGQKGGKSTTAYAYPDLNGSGEVVAEKEIKISDYSPNPGFKVAGKEFDGWKIEGGDDDGTLYPDSGIPRISEDTTFIAQWKDLAGVKIVLSSVDGPVAQMRVEDLYSEDNRITDFLNDDAVKTGLNALISQQGDGYIVDKELTGRPRYWASNPMSDFADLNEFQSDLDVNATIGDLGDDYILYVAAFKPVDKVAVSIEVPLCGTVTSATGAISTNPPKFTVSECAGYSTAENPYALLWLTGKEVDDVFNGTMKGEEEYFGLGVNLINPDYGYTFSDNTEVTLDGGELEQSSIDGQYISMVAKVKAVHVWGKWEAATPATCSAKGTEQRTCRAKGCNKTESRETEGFNPNAHDYGTPSYNWAPDNSSVTAKVVCNHNNTHNITETVQTASSVVKDATCREMGKTKYVAAFKNDVFTNQSKTLVDIDIDPDAHKWGEWKVTKPATETEEGEEKRTCSLCDKEETRPIKKLDPTPTPAPKKVTATSILLAKQVAKGNKSLVISWTRVNSANGYDIFFARCGSGSLKKVKTIKGNKTLKWTRKGLKKRASYKAVVKAYVIKNGKKTYVATSPMVHAYTSGGTKRYTNPKSVKVNKTKVAIKAGNTYKIKASVIKLRKGKSLIPAAHAPKLRYLSSNNKIATVNSSGVIKASGKGTCTVYVYAANGLWKTCKVTVN